MIGFVANLLVAVAAYRVADRVARQEHALARLLVWIVAATAVVVLSVEVGGIARLLRRPAMVFAVAAGLSVGLLAFTSAFPSRSPRDSADGVPRSGEQPLFAARSLPAWAAACVALAWIPLLCDRLPLPPVAWDALTYHLTFPVRWLQSGDLSSPVPLAGDPAHPYYPLVGQMLLYWNLATCGTDRWTVVSQVPFLAIGACGVALLALQRGASPRVAACAALAWAGTPVALRTSVEVMVDLAPATFFVATLALAESARRPGSALLGLAAWTSFGLLLGTKYSGVLLGLAALPLVLRIPAGVAATAGGALAAVAVGGYAYLRNLASGGNPFLPLEVAFGPWTIFPGPAGAAEYFGESAPRLGWNALLVSARSVLEMGVLFLPLLAGLAWTLATGRGGRSLAAVAVAAFGLSALLLPFREHRYFLPVTAAAWGAVGAAASRAGRRIGFERVVVAALALQVPITLFYWLKELWTLGWSSSRVAGVGAAVAVAAGLVLVRLPRGRVRLALGAGVVSVVVAAILTGPAWEKERYERWGRFWASRYLWEDLARPREDLRDLGEAWSWIANETRSRAAVVAYSGMNVPYPLTGLGNRNRVVAVCRNERAATSIYRWGILPPDPGASPSRRAWMENLAELEVDYLCVFRLYVAEGGTGRFPIEDDWARGAPDRFTLRWAAPWARIYAVHQ